MNNNIIIIDDYSINLKVAQMIIKQYGFFENITLFSEAKLALEYLINHQKSKTSVPNIILLDLNMPVMDGWQFLNEFENLPSSLTKEIKIYILSSSTDIRDIQRSRQYISVKGFFSKPLIPEMLHDIRNANLSNAG